MKEGKESELYLGQKLEQKDHELEAAERKIKDLQLRMKRFVKDDKAKDERILSMEKELRDLTDKMNSLTEMLDQNANAATTATSNGTIIAESRQLQKKSSVCVIL